MKRRRILKALFEPFVVLVAAVYFVLDVLFLSLLRPLLRRIGNLKLLQVIEAWIASLGPYSIFVLFATPLVLLEPVKIFGTYLMATGYFKLGISLLSIGEVLKISIVERIFHIGRDKLMTIPAFAWVYNFAMGWLAWLQTLSSWKAVKRSFKRMES